MATISPEELQQINDMFDAFNKRIDAFNKRIDASIETMVEELRKSNDTLRETREIMVEGFDRVHQDCSELALRFDRLDRSFDRHLPSNRQTYRRDSQPFVIPNQRSLDENIFPSLRRDSHPFIRDSHPPVLREPRRPDESIFPWFSD